ncbi:SDR family oxidoreductase [Neptunomonas antarctica]|uniref:NAD(P)-dependent dehydrogenase, short-chain alcohol dehydrogenase family n=1 Tax=Neptunomonas antarctica TaxID=619304 RepID=A0A1N7L5T5_9GAMM|nr:SDR family oxidoreductase [Neptunomonas antarctica]SIS69151.1 NAD(P)-dependent dehydrogenase, short-chain alcohol dehydrogenase family [Neptunomonas antarctica]
MPTILITGANRGIGLALTRSYLQDGWRVFAASRKPGESLVKEAEEVTLDLSNPESIKALKSQLAGIPIDIVWNNAGVYLDKNQNLEQLDNRDWLRSFEINCIAPIRIAEALAENVRMSERKVIAFTTSKMASLTVNGAGAYAYRSSKTALNMAVRCFAQDKKSQEISCLLLHPGHVKTDMGGPEGDIDIATSVTGMRKVVDQFNPTCQADMDRGYFNYDGSRIPW